MADTDYTQRVIPRSVHWYNIRRWGLYEWLLFIAVVVFLLSLGTFLWADKSRFDFNHPINFNKFGTFGDFIGGVVGTVFAFLNVHLLIKTIGLQNKANVQSEKSYAYVQKTENVRTMDTQINSLLSLYNSVVEAISFQNKQGKEGLEAVTNYILSNSNGAGSAYLNDESAINAFETIYASLRDKLAVYFRVIYRMLCVLKQADIDDKVRYNYAKMLRSQFTESELFLLRYNALTYNGKNMQEQILAFNLLKHLPASKLFDLHPFFSHLNNDFSNHLDIMLYDFRKELEKTFIYGRHLDEMVSFQTNITNLSLAYKVFPDRRAIDIVFQVNRNLQPDSGNLERAIARYSDIDIRSFFKAYLLEIFSKSMFQVYTKVEELIFRNFHRYNDFVLNMSLDCREQGRTLMLSRKQLNTPRTFIGPIVFGNQFMS